MKKQSRRRTRRGQMCHLTKMMEKIWTGLLKALWLITPTSHRDWTVQHCGYSKKCGLIRPSVDYSLILFNEFTCLSLSEWRNLNFLVFLSPLYQTQRCTVFTWSQWEALQSRASSKCPTGIITTWTYFPRYTMFNFQLLFTQCKYLSKLEL